MTKKIIIALCAVAAASAAIAAIPTNKADLSKTTLTELNKLYPTIYPKQSAYQLTEGSLGNFVITQYWDNLGTLTPVNYNVVFKNTLGTEATTFVKYFKWDSSSGENKLVESDSSSYDIIAKTPQNGRANITAPLDAINYSFIGLNTATNTAAISNSSTIGKINGDFVNNGFSSGLINNGVFIGGAIFNSSNGTINEMNANFIEFCENISFECQWRCYR